MYSAGADGAGGGGGQYTDEYGRSFAFGRSSNLTNRSYSYPTFSGADLSAAACLKAGWGFFRNNWLFYYVTHLITGFTVTALLGLVIFIFTTGLSISGADTQIAMNRPAFWRTIWLEYMFFCMPVLVAQFVVLARGLRGDEISALDVVALQRRYLPTLAACTVTVVLILAGSAVLVIPGLIFFSGLIFAAPLAMDREPDFLDAVVKSWEMMNGHKLRLFGLLLLLLLINLLGVLPLGLGLLITIPVSYCSLACFYNRAYEMKEPT